jgi:DNA-binding beta-propeller fold protein YncE
MPSQVTSNGIAWLPLLLVASPLHSDSLFFASSPAFSNVVIEEIVSLAPGNSPEGIAASFDGRLYVGNRQQFPDHVVNTILRVQRDGSTKVFAALPDSDADAHGLLGLAVAPAGDVYAALASFDPTSHGVWQVSRNAASKRRLEGSVAIGFPNAMTFDRQGNLYVTDSQGAIWRCRAGQGCEPWVADPLLAPLNSDPFGSPAPGANGIAFLPPDRLFVANTEQSLIAVVRIGTDGSAGTPQALTAPFTLLALDGITVDAQGNLYVVLPAFEIVGSAPIVRLNPDTGEIVPPRSTSWLLLASPT